MTTNMDKVIDVVYTHKVVPYRETSEEKRNFIKVSFDEFLALMRRANICIDPRTARTRWETLIAKDIFVKSGNPSKVAFLDLAMMETLGYDCDLLNEHTHNTHTKEDDSVIAPAEINTHTTHTQKLGGVQ